MSVKQEFIEIFKENIKRPGSEKLLEWLCQSDFFVAPASTKYHSAFEGGLVQHSLNVINFLKNAVRNTESPMVKALLSADFSMISARRISIQ